MKNLTSSLINLIAGERRIQLPATEIVPKLIVGEHIVLGIMPPHGVEIIQQVSSTIDFGGIELKAEDQPFIVSREIFDALPDNCIEFVTPDYETAIMNGLNVPHVVRRLISKPAVTVIINGAVSQSKAA